MDGNIDTLPTKRPAPFVTSRGLKFPKDGKFIKGRLRLSLRNNQYEQKESDAVLRILKPEDTVIELGAGIGYMSTLMAKKRAIKAVHSFEANPELIPFIRAVHAANDVTNAHVTHAVLGKRKGKADFYIRNRWLASSLSPQETDKDPEIVKVDVLNAKTVFKDIQPNVLVCDIEGAEADLIPILDLRMIRAAVIELHPDVIGPKGVNKVFQAFQTAGLAYHAKGSDAKVVTFLRAW